MNITALAPWFGSARLMAEKVGKAMEGCRWVGVPFAGGMTELMYIAAPTLVVSDLHRHVINLARVVQDREKYRDLKRRLEWVLFHPDQLAASQEWERFDWTHWSNEGCTVAALNYFIAAWMGRSGKAGTDGEWSGGLSTRWNAGGGDSCKRFRSAARALVEWHRTFKRANFHTLPCWEFIGKVKDEAGHGLYCDSPWPDVGEKYSHTFTEHEHREWARVLHEFGECRVVCRFNDHPLVRELYSDWWWHELTGRDQHNQEKAEVLICNQSDWPLCRA